MFLILSKAVVMNQNNTTR